MFHISDYGKATGITASWYFAVFLFANFLGPYFKTLGLDNFQIGLILGSAPLVVFFTSPIIGALSDDVGRKRMIIFGIFLQLIAIALYIYDRHWTFLLIARMIEALSFAGVALVGIAKIEDNLEDSVRGKYAGISLSIMNIGRLIAPVIGGVMADRLFVKAPFLLSFGLLALLLLALLSKKDFKFKKIPKGDFNFWKTLKEFMKHRPLKGMGFLGMSMHTVMPLLHGFLSIYIIEQFDLSYRFVGYAFFVFGLPHVFQFLFGSLSDRMGRAKSVVLGTLLFGSGLLLMYFANSYDLFLVLFFVMGIGAAIWNVSAWSQMSDIGEKLKVEGRVVGAYISIAKVGSFVSWIISGVVAKFVSIGVLLPAVAVIILVTSILTYPLLKSKA